MELKNFLNSELLETIFYGNSLKDYLVWIFIVSLGFLFKKNFSKYITKIVFNFIKKSTNINLNDFYIIVKKPIDFLILLLFLYFGSRHISFNVLGTYWENLIGKLFVFVFMMCFIWFFLRLTDYFKFILMQKAEKTSSKLDDQFVPFFSSLLKVIIVILGVFTVLATVFDIDITALAAGLGVGGIAVAMASKESLENLLKTQSLKPTQKKLYFTAGSSIQTGDWLKAKRRWFELKDKWQRYSFQYKATSKAICLILRSGAPTLVDGIQVEQNNKATAFIAPPVEGDLLTSDKDDFIHAGKSIDARFKLFGKPGTTGNLKLDVYNYYREKVYSDSASIKLGKDGSQIIPLKLEESKTGKGVFIVKATYEIKGFDKYS